MSTAIWLSVPSLDRTIEGGSRDLEGPAYFGNGVAFLVEILGNTELSSGEGSGSAASFASSTGCRESCLCPLPN